MDLLFTPAKLGTCELKNRIVRLATNGHLSDEKGQVTPLWADTLIELAKNEELTQEKFDAYDSMWYDVREKCEFFLPHCDVYELNLRVSETKGYVENKDFESCLVQLEVVKRLAMYVRHLAEPKLRHIL